jgi:glycosyltransferase involved in cell wall biosynthesis
MTQPFLVCLLPARNAEEDLPEFLACVEQFCDAIVALDDGSTDGTGEILRAHPLVKTVLRNERRENYRDWNDAENRNKLLAAAHRLDPEWIISLDADERLDARDASSIRPFLETDGLPGCAFGFRHVPMKEDHSHFMPTYDWVYRLFSTGPRQMFRPQKLHFAPIPTNIPQSRWFKTTLRIQHLGEMTAERRLDRFAKYLEADPKRTYQADYQRVLASPSRQQLRRWQSRPEGVPVLMADVQAASIAESLMDDNQKPIALSVIVIAQNDEATIAASIGAIVDQECPDPFEVIVVTSGTDRTAEIVRSGFPDVTIVELPKPALPGEARNAGLRIARGTYVTFPGSHVQLKPGSLARRLRAHRRGYAMVTGVTENGTLTPPGWASYFLDHADGLPGQAPAQLNGPPAHCSYARQPLLEVGGFPEGVRTAEDTAVNRDLVRRGYVAYRDPGIRFVHRSPCTTWRRLVRHHFGRGQGWGRMLVARHEESGHLLSGEVIRQRLTQHIPERLRRISAGVATATPDLQEEYQRVQAGILLGAIASWVGMWTEILRPAPGKMAVLTGRPRQTLLIVSIGEVTAVHLAHLDRTREQVTVKSLPATLPVVLDSGEVTSVNDLVSLHSTHESLAGENPQLIETLLSQMRASFVGKGIECVVGARGALSDVLPGLSGNLEVNTQRNGRDALQRWGSLVRSIRSNQVASSMDGWTLLGALRALRKSSMAISGSDCARR